MRKKAGVKKEKEGGNKERKGQARKIRRLVRTMLLDYLCFSFIIIIMMPLLHWRRSHLI